MTTPTTLRLPVLALVLALALPAAFAVGDVRVDATSAPFADDATALGVDLAWDGDLVLVLAAEGTGALGDALVPVADAAGLPIDALGRIVSSEAIERSGVVTVASGGVAYLLDGDDVRAAAGRFEDRLGDLGFHVDASSDGRVLTFDRDGRTFRATFGVRDAGVQVFVAEL